MKTTSLFKLTMLGIFLISCREIESEAPKSVTFSAKVPTDQQKLEPIRKSLERKDSLKVDSSGQQKEITECCGDHGQIPIKN